MKTDKNTWKGLFFFFLRLISVCVAVVVLYLAYDVYTQKKVDKALESVAEDSVQLFEDIVNQLSN